MPDEGSTNDWDEILSRRLERDGQGSPERPPAAAAAGAGEEAVDSEPQPAASTREGAPPAPPAEEGRRPGASGTGEDRPPRPPRPSPPTSVIPRPAGGPRGHYTGAVHGGRAQPLDSLGPGCGGITTGWKVPTTGGLPGGGALPASGTPAAAATSAELVVKKLTSQISARQETRALNILRGKGSSGSGLGLAMIMVLSAGAVFAGTYLWTQAVRERGILLTAEGAARAPEEIEEEPALAPEPSAPAPTGVASRVSPVSQGKGSAARRRAAAQRRDLEMLPDIAAAREPGPKPTEAVRPVTGAGTPRRRAKPAVSVKRQPPKQASARPLLTAHKAPSKEPFDATGEDVAREDLTDEEGEGAVFTLGRPLRMRSRTDEWVELGGPLFDEPAAPSKRPGDQKH